MSMRLVIEHLEVGEQPHRDPERSHSVEPTAGESRPPQSGDDGRTTAHDVPDQPSAVVFNHQDDRPLIDAEMYGVTHQQVGLSGTANV